MSVATWNAVAGWGLQSVRSWQARAIRFRQQIGLIRIVFWAGVHCMLALAYHDVRCGAACVQDPNPEDPLNKEAAEMQQSNARQFEAQVQASIRRGTYIGGTYFPPCSA